MTQLTAAPTTLEDAADGYADLERLVSDRVNEAVGPLFTTDAHTLWDAYLENLTPSRRQHYNCSCCRRFIEKFGGLVTIDESGQTYPVLWSMVVDAPPFFQNAIIALYLHVREAKPTGLFLWSDKERTWGRPGSEPKTDGGGAWTHLSGSPSVEPYTNPTLTAGQAIAAKRQAFQILSYSLADYPIEVVAQASRILHQDAVYRSEKAIGVATWFTDLHRKLENVKGPLRDNIIWLAAATAPVGFCHVRSTVISTLLDDIKEGLAFDAIARRWQEKLHPLQYQRPSAAPSEGAIAAAEKLVERLGVAKSLERRFATLDDVLAKVWSPTAEKPKKSGGIFGHLKGKIRAIGVELPNTTMTWDKFHRTVLPSALSIELRAPSSGPYYGLVTAADMQAPAILQWDGLQDHPRNPVSWYFYHNGSTAQQWGLIPDNWVSVSAVFLAPHAWQEPRFTHQGQNAFFALEGCRDTRDPGLCLFPEILKSEFHAIRSVIEAHSRTGGIQGAEHGTANGIALQKGGSSNIVVRVRTAEGTATYTLDRWD